MTGVLATLTTKRVRANEVWPAGRMSSVRSFVDVE